MKKVLNTLVWSMTFLVIGCSKQDSSFPDVNDLSVKWELLENNYQGKGIFRSKVHITNSSVKTLDNKGWELYFNFTPSSKITMDSIPGEVKLVHLNGNFFKIVPTTKFVPLKKGQTYSLTLLGSFVAIKYSDAPGGFYFIVEESPGRFSEPLPVNSF
jgi:hexosaminidase